MELHNISNKDNISKSIASNFGVSNPREDDDEFKKSGEGSKGGKVIGHTKSGKPIYDTANHSGHKDFSKEDHLDAAKHHKNKANRHSSFANKYKEDSETYKVEKDASRIHKENSEKHKELANKMDKK